MACFLLRWLSDESSGRSRVFFSCTPPKKRKGHPHIITNTREESNQQPEQKQPKIKTNPRTVTMVLHGLGTPTRLSSPAAEKRKEAVAGRLGRRRRPPSLRMCPGHRLTRGLISVSFFSQTILYYSAAGQTQSTA